MKKTVVVLLVLALMAVASLSFAEGAPTITLSESELTIVKGKTARIQATVENVENPKKVKYSWESSDTTVFTVANGNIQAKDGGSATLTCVAELEDGSLLQANATITVNVLVSGLKMNTQNNLTIYPGETATLDYTISPDNVTDKSLDWSSKDESIVTVSNGVITAKKPGKTTVSAKTKDGSNRTMQLSVYVPSMVAGTYDVTVNSYTGKDYFFKYFGDDWSNNVTVQSRGNHSNVTYSKSGTDIKLSIKPLTSGDDVITFTDKKDAKSKVVLNIHVEDAAIAAPFGIVITSVTLNQGNYNASYQINVQNALQKTIGSISYLVDYYDKFGDQRYCYSTIDNTLSEFGFDYDANIAGGRTSTIKNSNYVFDKSSPISEIRVAINGYRFSDGTSVVIPDSQLYWFSSSRGYLTRPSIKEIYKVPSSSVYQKSENFMVGFTSFAVYSYIAKTYAHSKYPGRYVSVVNSDSIAEKSGMKVGDVIYGIDEMLWTDEPELIDIAKARMYEGKTVTYHIIRNGTEKDFEMKLE